MIKRLLSVAILLLAFSTVKAQLKSDILADIKNAKSPKSQIKTYFKLANFYFLNNRQASDSAALIGIALAEATRDKTLIVHAQLDDASRFVNINPSSHDLQEARNRANKAYQISNESKNPNLIATCHVYFATLFRISSEPDNAVKESNLAISLIPDVTDDSVKILSYNTLGQSLSSKDDMLNAFKAYLNALTIAEESKKQSLLIICYYRLRDFYSNIQNFERAKDFAFKALALNKKSGSRRDMLDDYMGIAKIYVNASDNEMAKLYYSLTEKLADSLNASKHKTFVKIGLLNMYFNSNQFVEGYAFLRKNADIYSFLKDSGMQPEIDKANGYIQMMLCNYDSSFYYYNKARSFYESSATPIQSFQFFHQYALVYKKMKQWDKAIVYEDKAKEIIEKAGSLENLDLTIQRLDSLHYNNGDFKKAYEYEIMHQKLSDSLRALSEKNDIVMLEIENETKRAEKEKQAEEQEEIRRYNLQYLGITAAIGGVFIVLVVLGLFRVSAGVVKAIGFFAFIFLFEFIIMIADNKIHHLTHGEPWKVWLIKIILIAILLPLHHWLEEKVIHFLTQHHLLVNSGLNKLSFRKAKPVSEDTSS